MRRERGFILATTLLVITLLTVMLTAAFVMISAEFRTTNASYAASRSLNLAQAGLQSYFSYSHSLSSASYDSTNYTFSGGYAQVVARQMHDSTAALRELWIVYSTGVDTTRTLANQGTGKRVVAQLAYLENGTVPARAPMVAINGDSMLGSGPNPIDGNNRTGASCTGKPSGWADDTLGLTVGGATGYYNGGTDYSAFPRPTGDNITPSVEILVSPSAVLDSTRIDWEKLTGGSYTADYSNSWPAFGASSYQTHYFTGDAVVPSGGLLRGMLIVEGDVTLSNDAHWDGIILAGGRLITPTGSTTEYIIHGMIITGLNLALSQTVQKNLVQRGATGYTRAIIWDWCYTRSSFGSQSYLTPVSGTYFDIWNTY